MVNDELSWDASATYLGGSVNGRIGTVNNNINGSGEGQLAKAEAKLHFSPEGSKGQFYGAYFKGGGEAAAAKGKIGVNGTFFGGIDMGVSVGGSAGSIGANGTAPFFIQFLKLFSNQIKIKNGI